MVAMSRIPDFANIAFENTARAEPAGGAEPWLTPEGILVKPGYDQADLRGIDFLETWPGIAPYLRGPFRSNCGSSSWKASVPLRRRYCVRTWRTGSNLTATAPIC